jgi:hypothetical protein
MSMAEEETKKVLEQVEESGGDVMMRGSMILYLYFVICLGENS